MTGIRATYNPDKRTLKYSWPDGTYSIFEDFTEDEARAKTGLSGVPLDIATTRQTEDRLIARVNMPGRGS